MSQINQRGLAHVLPTDNQSGDDPPTSSPPLESGLIVIRLIVIPLTASAVGPNLALPCNVTLPWKPQAGAD